MSITAGSVIASANAKKATGTAAATITAGQTLYADPNDGMWLNLADNNGNSAAIKCVGIALMGAARGNPVDYVYEDPDLAIGATVTVGAIYGLSDTPGGIMKYIAAGDLSTLLVAAMYPNVLFIGKTATTVNMKILSSTVAAV